MDIVESKNGVPIRLTDERWVHITEEHSELAGYYYEVLETISAPTAIYEGKADEFIAYKEIQPGKFLLVIYKEESNKDGFIITSFLSRNIKRIKRRKQLWHR